MWLFILIYALGLNISQASGADNSTQMYYVKLAIDKNAIGNITQLLMDFVVNNSVQVSDLKKTTTCQNTTGSVQCTCEPCHKWSKPECRDTDTCTFSKTDDASCVSNTSVTISGTMELSTDYSGCLTSKESDKYKECNVNVMTKIKENYSTLSGFDRLTILKYRFGSIHVDFFVQIANAVNSKTLINVSTSLSKALGPISLETSGVVQLEMPKNTVAYNSNQTLKCIVQEDLQTSPVWQLKKENSNVNITNGTQAELTEESLSTTARITGVNELWEGEYSCFYKQTSVNKSFTIIHKASGTMDIALLPNIVITTNPSFPLCQNKESVTLKVQCNVDNSQEDYTVEWNSSNIVTLLKLSSGDPKGIYEAQIIVKCGAQEPKVTCLFTNQCNQTRSASTSINLINENDKLCKAEGDWEDTKAGFPAVLKCKDNGAGQRKRDCNREGTWGPEISSCVNKAVNKVLQKATIVDIGLGDLQENAADVFSLLENITNNTQSINNFATMNASVQVLLTLSQKNNLKPNSTATDDFLESSSNLLNKSLSDTWKANPDTNFSLAEKYLESVEKLIKVADIPYNTTKKKYIEVAAKNCSEGSQCNNKVFNVTVRLDGKDLGTIKTAGFKELESYLPTKGEKYEPNSIVVSTTAERTSSSFSIEIDFPLTNPRPRNVRIECVSWDSTTGNWSSEGCLWLGPLNERRCICNHLSSFAILMSKTPLDIPFMTEITYTGLSVSVMSLIISLTIEMIVWSTVVKTNSLYLRHTSHVNISLTLLIADCCFLASSEPSAISVTWCEIVVLFKHFCYLAMFFWMLCLSTTLLHQAVFPLHQMSKKAYLRFSLLLGYVCPMLIVFVTFVTNKASSENRYFSKDTCWLVYDGLLKGSIYTFVIPVGIIVFTNIFSMVVVILKLLHHPQFAKTSNSNEKRALVTVMRSVVLLTPIFGVTWTFGFAVMIVDLTAGPLAFAINYIFTTLNAFQGFFILLTTCLFDKMTRNALLDRFKISSPSLVTEGSTKSESIQK